MIKHGDSFGDRDIQKVHSPPKFHRPSGTHQVFLRTPKQEPRPFKVLLFNNCTPHDVTVPDLTFRGETYQLVRRFSLCLRLVSEVLQYVELILWNVGTFFLDLYCVAILRCWSVKQGVSTGSHFQMTLRLELVARR